MNTQKQINNYITRQTNWVKANNVQRSQSVLILRSHETESKGWQNQWLSEMNDNIGKIKLIHKILDQNGIHCKNDLSYPYTVLLPLDDKPKDYETKHFMWKDKPHTCIVSKLRKAKQGEFGWQRDDGIGTPILRKFDINFNNSITEMNETYEKKGYYPYNSFLPFYKGFEIPLVVASTLTGIGLPIIRF